MIRTQNVFKYYNSFKALDDVSFEIQKGEIVGILGQNGAGKTTLMRVLTTFFPASSGEVIVAGINAQSHPLAIRREIGYLPENPPLYDNLTVMDYLKFAAQVKGIAPREQKTRIDAVLSECWLTDVSNKLIQTLSKGYKQRVGLAQAIINDPQVLILDEPTSGLDPIQNNQIRKLIKSLEEKRTVILSTHILSEIEHIAKRVLVIKEGRIIKDDTLAHLLQSSDVAQKVSIRFKGNDEEIYQLVNSIGGPKIVLNETQGDVHLLVFEYKKHLDNLNTLAQEIIRLGGEIVELQEMHPNLEDVFFGLVEDKET